MPADKAAAEPRCKPLSTPARSLIAALIEPNPDRDPGLVFADPEIWEEVHAAFPPGLVPEPNEHGEVVI